MGLGQTVTKNSEMQLLVETTMKTVSVLVAVAALAAAASPINVDREWEHFQLKYGKNYLTSDEAGVYYTL